ncbi:MAG: MBOAT family protein [Myxococcaceae bacterium]|nr:MBOAT family protein [Myxococcaceae bacterium]
MLFHQLPFLVFLGLTFGAYWTVARWKWPRLIVLLVASLAFYAAATPLPLILSQWIEGRLQVRLTEVAWAGRPLLIFLAIAVVDHLCVLGMARTGRKGLRKLLVAVSVVSNLGLLSLFKYGDLFYSTTAALLEKAGVPIHYEPLGLLLPLGLSFVVFRAISVTVDVYRGTTKPTFTFFEHLLYLLFFPLLVSGPIVRARDLLDRFDARPTLDPDDGARALFRIAAGMVKKLAIADVIAGGLVDQVFANPTHYTSAECVMAAIGYTVQLYFDFSGYSDIAIGASALFGFPLPENFNKPYLARNLFEFWNRWHISLSSWLRDYFYIPLGGNRVSRPRALFNLMMVMVWGGLWHGADWRFMYWGGIHGIALCITRIGWWIKGGRPKSYGFFGSIVGWTITFTVVVATRIIFRAPSMAVAQTFYRTILDFTPGLANVSAMVWAALGAAAVLHALPHRVFDGASRFFVWLPAPARAVALVALALGLRQLAQVEVRPYIYFQF